MGKEPDEAEQGCLPRPPWTDCDNACANMRPLPHDDPESYIHGTCPQEQARLTLLNRLTNPPFLAWLDLRPTDTVLEIGSGLGILAQEVAKRVPEGEVIGLERSKEQLAASPADTPGLKFVQGDAHHLPFGESRFDLVYCRYLLEHVADPARVVREMFRVLKPGGRAYAQENNILVNDFDPDCPQWDRVWERFVELQRRLGGDARIGKRLYALFRQAGFSQIALSLQPEIHHAGQPTFVLWVQNLIGNVEGARAKLQAYGLASEVEIDGALSELRHLMTLEDAGAYFYWNRACGIKPGGRIS
jgi:SAM-dependent methyltransferase